MRYNYHLIQNNILKSYEIGFFWFHCPNFSQDLFLTRCYQNIKTTNDFPIADAACLGGACVITGRGVPLGVTGSNITGHQSRRRRRGRKSGVTSIRGFSSLLPGSSVRSSQKDDHKVAGRRALSRRDICHMLRNGNVCDIVFAQE